MANQYIDIIARMTDEVSSVAKRISGTLTDMKPAFEGMAIAGTAAFGAISAGLVLSVKEAADAQLKMANFDAALSSMKGRAIEVATGLTLTSSSLKITGVEAAKMKNEIQAASIAIRDKQQNLIDLNNQLSKGKISQADYAIQVASTRNQIEGLNLKIQEYGSKLGAVDTKTIGITKTIKITQEELNKARDAFISASKAAVQLGFDDETAAVAMSKFFQVTGDVKKSITDTSLAMDLARAKNITLEEAATSLSKALAGQARILTAYGIKLEDGASAAEIFAKVQELVGGRAEAVKNTLEVQLLVLKETFNNLKQAIGDSFIPVISSLLNSIAPVILKITEWINANPELTRNIILVALAVSGVVAAVGTLGLIIGPIIAGFVALSGPIGIIIAVAIGLAAIVSQLHINWQDLLTEFSKIDILQFLQGVMTDLRHAFEFFIDTVKSLMGIATELYNYFSTNIMPVLMALWETLATFVTPIFNQLWQDLSTKLFPALKNLWNTIATQLLPSLLELWKAAQPLVIVFGAALYGAFVLVVSILGIMLDTLARVLTLITQVVNFIVQQASAQIKAFADAINAVANAFQRVYEWGQKAAQYIGGAVGGAVSSVKSSLGIKDGVVQGGHIVSTDPKDFIIAMQNPGALAGGGGIVVNINGGTYLDRSVAEEIGDMIIDKLKLNIRV